MRTAERFAAGAQIITGETDCPDFFPHTAAQHCFYCGGGIFIESLTSQGPGKCLSDLSRFSVHAQRFDKIETFG